MKNLLRILSLLLITVSLVSCDKDDNYEIIIPNSSIIYGKWENIGFVDSTVLVFENETMKKYVFDRSSKMPLDYVDYGRYYLSRTTYDDGRTDDNYIKINYYDEEHDGPDYYNKNRLGYFLGKNTLGIGGEFSWAKYTKITN